MAAREDLRGQSPREVLLAKKDFIDSDLHSRELQWSFTGECPPPLPRSANAYLRAGFGTHEIVLYYELVRVLLAECFERVRSEKEISLKAMAAHLRQIKTAWLDAPDGESGGRTPSQMIESERKRVNLIMSAREILIDEDCDVC